jgi:hypothetical protein
MKKIMSGLVVLVSLLVSVPSFGDATHILIYNISASVKGADDDTGLKATVPLKGYLILTLSDATTIEDADLILYGKDASTTPKKVYVRLNYTEMTDQHFVYISQIGDYLFLEIGEYTDAGPSWFDVLVMGKWKVTNVGPLVGDENVAKSMKGAFVVWGGYLLGPSIDQDISGTSNISLTLNKAGTKWANGNNDEGLGGAPELKTQDDVIEGAIGPDGILTNKGYIDATP